MHVENFTAWMKTEGLSESSILKYKTAIGGSLSKWAQSANFSDSTLYEISSFDEFLKVSSTIIENNAFIERDRSGHGLYSSALKKYSEYLFDELEKSTDRFDIGNDSSKSKTERFHLATARIGQGKFRADLIKYWKGCSVSRYKDTRLLLASHIKPWAASSNAERLDRYNGLLLTPNLDQLFDKGFISFDHTGMILLSKQFKFPGLLGICPNISAKLTHQHLKFMQYHRENIYLGKRKE